MQKLRIFTIAMLIGLVLVSCSPEKPALKIVSKNPTTWIEVANSEPETLDPSLSYESAAGEILQNTLDNLIFFDQDSSEEFVPMLAAEVPSVENGGISEDGMAYEFRLRGGVVFHDGTPLTAEDVAFTFVRNILAGGTDSPQWMLVEPIYGAGLTDIAEVVAAAAAGADLADPQAILANRSDAKFDDRAALSASYPPELLEQVCEDLKARIVPDEMAGKVTFKLAQPWAPFLMTLAGGSWGGIQSKAWVSANGGWDGDCKEWVAYYGWTVDEFNATPLGKQVMGTGPFKLNSWTEGDRIVLVSNDYYWMDSPLWDGAPTGPASLEKVIITQVANADKRLSMAINGDADNIMGGSPTEWPKLDELVGEEYTYTEWMDGLYPFSVDEQKPFRKIVEIPAANSRTDIGFQFQINAGDVNDFIGSGVLDGNGIPPDFFQDVHVRRAFSFCFDYDRYRETVHSGEGTRAATLMLPGMSGYDANAPHYIYSVENCRLELEASSWTTCTYLERDAERAMAAVLAYTEEDTSVTLEDLEAAAVEASQIADACTPIPLVETGFRLSMPYSAGNAEQQAMAEIMQAGFQQIGQQFIIETVGLPRADYERAITASGVPLFAIDWLSDYNDTHNWLSAFTCSFYPLRQGFPEDDRQAFCDIGLQGVQILDPIARDAFYKEVFNTKYYNYAPAILLYNLDQRVYQPRYVRGWYANASYANKWYYPLWKE